jgi:putative Mn2+ efflux pump MntP
MEQLIIIILLAIALAMDAFAVATTLGMSNIAKKKIDKLKIALTFGLFQGGLFLLGYYTLAILGKEITTYNSLIAGLLLAFLGVKMLLDSFDNRRSRCDRADCSGCKRGRCLNTGEYRYLSIKILFTYGIATSIDAFAAGISYGLEYSQIILAFLFICLVTFFLSLFGATCGIYLKKYVGNKAEIIGGVILIILAIKTLI